MKREMENYKKYFDESVYAFDGEKNIIGEGHIGICSDVSSILTPPTSVNELKCMQGCPYTNSAFDFDVRLDGESVKVESWKWLPNAIIRNGKTDEFSLSSLTVVASGMRTVVHKITITNRLKTQLCIPVTALYRGAPRKEQDWQFPVPNAGSDSRENYCANGRILTKNNDEFYYAITTSLENMRLFKRAYIWENEITLAPNESKNIYFSIHLGTKEIVDSEIEKTLDLYEEIIEKSFDYLKKEVTRIYDALPRLTSSDPRLDNLYYRSLVTYIMCRWENPDLCVIPYFSTGSVNGACMCSYLWDYCGGLMLHPVYDAEANKKQLTFYLKNDLTTSYALNPVTAAPVGPWYQVNQEKIIMMVYYHVLATGDKDFLHEQAGERTVIEWMKYHAYVCDDLSKDAQLYDYGEGGKHHLELYFWGNKPYDGIMPDLNARRYLNYMRAYELTVLAGEPDERLPLRASQLKEQLKTLWNDEKKWYDYIDAQGNRDMMYTVQMFKFINSDVIDEYERDGLVSHLNDEEFLSKFGLHSISKLDPEYDQDDIDNGGGGICTHFTMHICAQLYARGYDSVATDILKRVYWWGERLPYMGDSCSANMIKNRENTPLQGDISSTACAQMIFFFIFGIKPTFDGKITISPVKNRPCDFMRVDNVRFFGKVFSVIVNGEIFAVEINGEKIEANVGNSITI